MSHDTTSPAVPDTSSTLETPSEDSPSGVVFWVGVAIGVSMITFGVVGVLRDEDATVPRNLALWLFGSGIVHDAVILPLAVLAGWATGRVLPPYARTPVRLGLAWSALVSIMFWPAVRGWGVRAGNPSLFPLDYARNLILTLVVTWVFVGLATILNRRRTRRTSELTT